ncbi:helix-turn-helix domain-containing protein [Geobacter sulfurreducens]|uniref:helix-turn-helix domain-containing protein n=1 Tax=Geobacter sulfurreducens TaxID=35554 RepID=UPI000DBB29A2|nr:helix-turn-helix domain-containing protein [Geobacter sulfurreducens]BBA68908.1 hypothetical protein YM18_0351 [Geobacter sulfurreducens]
MDNLAEHSDRTPTPIVAIDGTTIRRIREAKRLTQLYVASVVGVTTDTISRWENNRYPSVKRDNAEKLAQALEVSLEDILRREGTAEDVPAENQPKFPPLSRRLLPAIILLLAGAAILGVVLFRGAAPGLKAERTLPPYCAPGQILPVRVKVERPAEGGSGFILKERIPAGWRFVSANPRVTGEAGAREIKWLIPAGAGAMTISYTLLSPREIPLKTAVDFGGEVVRSDEGGTRREPVGGAARVTVAGIHWADVNGDGRIDDNEIMPAYYLTEEMKGLGLDWKTIETIWTGAGYTWNDKLKAFEVVR